MSEFQRFLAKRIGISVLLTLVAVSVIFFTLRLLPGSPFTQLVASGNLTEQQVREIMQLYGLNRPLSEQYLAYLRNLLTFQFGYSIRQSRPVWEILGPKLLNTLVLLIPALVCTAILSTLLGMVAGWNRGSWLETGSIVTTTFFRSTPVFISALGFIIVFAYTFNLVPAFGMRDITVTPNGVGAYFSIDFLHHYILPFTVAMLYYSGDFLLLARNGIVERKGSAFLKLHRAKGLSETEQLWRAGRNSLLPVLTYFALRLGMVFQGLILLEVVFGWPGIGRQLVTSIAQQDYPVVQAAVFLMALAVIIMNLVADVLSAYFDPTVSMGGGN
ncbi:ABC transporter permease [Halocatena marina]|uniref:ABC transporter permease n=1 Tax=Halocatena marina TaxID=2934937 RepID=UPI00200D490F|nr:ABC transporter permease [Halocatena marina]